MASQVTWRGLEANRPFKDAALLLFCLATYMAHSPSMGVVYGLPVKAMSLASPVSPFSAMWLLPRAGLQHTSSNTQVTQCRSQSLLSLRSQAKFFFPSFL